MNRKELSNSYECVLCLSMLQLIDFKLHFGRLMKAAYMKWTSAYERKFVWRLAIYGPEMSCILISIIGIHRENKECIVKLSTIAIYTLITVNKVNITILRVYTVAWFVSYKFNFLHKTSYFQCQPASHSVFLANSHHMKNYHKFSI